MQENLKLADDSKWDFLSEMSVYMNNMIQTGINELKGLKNGEKDAIDEKHQQKMRCHPVISTLRKDIYFKKNMNKEPEDKDDE